ncbi:hypothetical protein CASFOL_031311 [Castilleja foliolosa]|uniref:Uncharacterized protein n=1 Tax=Castilleja foliolosa TaxID=1961234 RepID=A0ABD3C4D1_9LAMI
MRSGKLDIGDGKEVDLKECPRSKIRQQCIEYLGPWIFVMSTSKRLYSGEKKKGLFHRSSFLAGGATLAAGRLIVDDGVLKCISAYSGHYRPTDDCLDTFLSFLNENGVNLDEVEENFKAGDICFEAKETCNNWFNKIGSVRELLPRM